MKLKAAAVAILFIIAAKSGVAAADYSDWMGRLDGKKRLSEFSIPGTHDSGALHEFELGRPIAGTAQCQVLPISAQLSSGVRFLDIRCVLKSNTFEIYHGSVDQQLSFDSVLGDCISFLLAHKGETIIMSVKKEHKEDDTEKFEAVFDSYTSKNAEMWLLKDTLPTLDEARGKIVLLRRFAASKLPTGIAAPPSDWEDNQSFQIHGRVEIRVQDRYALDGKDQKWPQVLALLQEAFTGKPDVLYLNFTSGYVKKTVLNYPDIRQVVDAVTPALSSYFSKASRGRYGVIILDFADSRKCAEVIGKNGREQD